MHLMAVSFHLLGTTVHENEGNTSFYGDLFIKQSWKHVKGNEGVPVEMVFKMVRD